MIRLNGGRCVVVQSTTCLQPGTAMSAVSIHLWLFQSHSWLFMLSFVIVVSVVWQMIQEALLPQWNTASAAHVFLTIHFTEHCSSCTTRLANLIATLSVKKASDMRDRWSFLILHTRTSFKVTCFCIIRKPLRVFINHNNMHCVRKKRGHSFLCITSTNLDPYIVRIRWSLNAVVSCVVCQYGPRRCSWSVTWWRHEATIFDAKYIKN